MTKIKEISDRVIDDLNEIPEMLRKKTPEEAMQIFRNLTEKEFLRFVFYAFLRLCDSSMEMFGRISKLDVAGALTQFRRDVVGARAMAGEMAEAYEKMFLKKK